VVRQYSQFAAKTAVMMLFTSLSLVGSALGRLRSMGKKPYQKGTQNSRPRPPKGIGIPLHPQILIASLPDMKWICQEINVPRNLRFLARTSGYQLARKPEICLTPLWQAKPRILKRHDRKASYPGHKLHVTLVSKMLAKQIVNNKSTGRAVCPPCPVKRLVRRPSQDSHL